MFDNSFTQLRLYFQLLHLLQIIQDSIQEATNTLRGLRSQHIGMLRYYVNTRDFSPASPETAAIVSKNWDTIVDTFDARVATLNRLITAKTSEIERLRDGVCNLLLLSGFCCNATTLSEASKSTSMNRHIIIFTAVTILYLPLGFVTAVYSMSLIGDEALSHLKGPYVGSMLVVAGLTYVISIAAVFFVDREKIMPRISQHVPVWLQTKTWFWHACQMLKITPPGPDPRKPKRRPPGISPPNKNTGSKIWGDFWPKGGLGTLVRRRRGKVGDQGGVPAEGVEMQAVQPPATVVSEA
ncbi:hypothetical protein B0T21DRAFT_284230 [Apiosordaria backusii]|uniref:Uncharacterized protein n=1 Tax=Apiosordaria backusii TaxID=314023 RepID=A0AA40BSD5_9PEZI|nr:hypothetical protein B0T21DRAFT_284230 [Apiosordaria backusii]